MLEGHLRPYKHQFDGNSMCSVVVVEKRRFQIWINKTDIGNKSVTPKFAVQKIRENTRKQSELGSCDFD